MAVPVKGYDKDMGGMDLSDALIQFFTVTQKTQRDMKLFLHFVDIAARSCKVPLSFIVDRIKIIDASFTIFKKFSLYIMF